MADRLSEFVETTQPRLLDLELANAAHARELTAIVDNLDLLEILIATLAADGRDYEKTFGNLLHRIELLTTARQEFDAAIARIDSHIEQSRENFAAIVSLLARLSERVTTLDTEAHMP